MSNKQRLSSGSLTLDAGNWTLTGHFKMMSTDLSRSSFYF